MRAIHVIGAVLLLTASSWAQVPEIYYDEGTWKVIRVAEPAALAGCDMRSSIHTIDKFGDPRWGYTYLEVDGQTHSVRLAGENMGRYFEHTRSALQIDQGELFPIVFMVPKQDARLIQLMKAGNTAVVIVHVLPTDQRFTHTFSLHGFTRGLAALDRCEASLR